MASIAGAVASITVAAPLDVVKTRIQNANFGSSVGGATIIKEMIKQEGMGAFFKGLTPKVSLIVFFFPCIAVDEMCILHILNYASDPRRRPQARVFVHARAEPDPLLRQIW